MTGLIKVLMETMFFGLISYLILIIIGGDSFSFGHLKDSMDFRLNWFVVSYIMLLLICPILERSLKGIDYSEFKTWMVLLMIFNLVFVFYMNRLNDNGYNVVHFVFLYYIARFLRESKGQQANWYSILERYSWLLYFIMVVALTAGYLFLNEYRHAPKSIKWFGYNNPILLLASISFFVSITKICIRSKVINLLATGVFGVFILHTTKYMIPWRNEFAHNVYLNYGYVGIILFSLCVLVSCLLITVPGSKVIKKIIGRINLPQYR